MTKRCIALLAFLVLVPLCLAEFKIVGPDRAEPYKLVRLSAEGMAPGAAVVWDVSDEEKMDLEEVQGRLIFTAPPGTYRVKARSILLDKDGKIKIDTARATITIGVPIPPGPPEAPAEVQATPSDGKVSLRWSPVSGVEYYSLYRGNSAGGESLLKSGISSTSWSDSGLTNGTAYFYQVTATREGRESNRSLEVKVTPDGPVDALVKALRMAYSTETDPQKATQKANLAALYRQSSQASFLATQTTWGTLFDAMRTAAGSLGVSGKLLSLQMVIQEELKVKLPTDRTKPLDADTRTLASTTFARIASALEAVVP